MGCDQTLIREVSDSLHLRRFCLISLSAPVPDESTMHKLTRRLGPELVDQLIRGVIEMAIRERMRCDSTVVEADIRYPTDAGLAGDAVRTLARAARKLQAVVPDATQYVRDRTRSVSKRLRMMNLTLRRRTGEAKTMVEAMTKEAAALVELSLRESKRLLARRAARGPASARSPSVPGSTRFDRWRTWLPWPSGWWTRFVSVSPGSGSAIVWSHSSTPTRGLSDVASGAIPTSFGYVVQLTEITANTRRGARPCGAFIRPVRQEAGFGEQPWPRTSRPDPAYFAEPAADPSCRRHPAA